MVRMYLCAEMIVCRSKNAKYHLTYQFLQKLPPSFQPRLPFSSFLYVQLSCLTQLGSPSLFCQICKKIFKPYLFNNSHTIKWGTTRNINQKIHPNPNKHGTTTTQNVPSTNTHKPTFRIKRTQSNYLITTFHST